MEEDQGNQKRNGLKERLAGGIGAGLGFAATLGVRSLSGTESFWSFLVLGMVLVGGGSAIGHFLAQKIASK